MSKALNHMSRPGLLNLSFLIHHTMPTVGSSVIIPDKDFRIDLFVSQMDG